MVRSATKSLKNPCMWKNPFLFEKISSWHCFKLKFWIRVAFVQEFCNKRLLARKVAWLYLTYNVSPQKNLPMTLTRCLICHSSLIHSSLFQALQYSSEKRSKVGETLHNRAKAMQPYLRTHAARKSRWHGGWFHGIARFRHAAYTAREWRRVYAELRVRWKEVRRVPT